MYIDNVVLRHTDITKCDILDFITECFVEDMDNSMNQYFPRSHRGKRAIQSAR